LLGVDALTTTGEVIGGDLASEEDNSVIQHGVSSSVRDMTELPFFFLMQHRERGKDGECGLKMISSPKTPRVIELRE